jgi:hypothetical protein
MYRSVSVSLATVTFAFALSAAAAGRDAWAVLAQAQTPEVCPQIWQPSAGPTRTASGSPSNTCFARAANATNVTPGECPN